MANDKNKPGILTKSQASALNRSNRKISGNINQLMDNISTMTYGISRTDKIDKLNDDFSSLLKGEIDDLKKTTDGDTTSFITKLFSDNNKRLSSATRELEDIFNVQEGQLTAFLEEAYRNRMIKHADLHEISSQLVELREAIDVTRDAIVSSDIITGHMSRNLTLDTDTVEAGSDNYIPIIEKIEDKFKLQEKIKNHIIPKTLEYGEYNVYHIPYSKLFEDFAKSKQNGEIDFKRYQESTRTVYDIMMGKDKKSVKGLTTFTESVIKETEEYKASTDRPGLLKEASAEVEAYLKNISICNEPVPIPVIEEGIESSVEYYKEFVESTMTEESSDAKNISFQHIMSGIDNGVFKASTKSSNSNRDTDFSNIKDCYIKLVDPIHLLPIELMNETIGYYFVQEEDITPLSGIVTSTIYYNNLDGSRTEDSILGNIADAVVASFDKKFLEKNMKFKKIIIEALNYYKLNNKRIKFQFIPKEYVTTFKVNADENEHGTSMLERSLFYAKLYLMLLLFKIMTIVCNSNDTKVNYVKQGVDRNITNKIQEIARKKQQRQITLIDMFSYTTLINKIGQGNEMYIPVGRSGERGIETEILSGQDVQMNNELMDMLKKAYITGTGVPDVLMNYINEADFAKTLELANNRFHGRVVSYQLDFNEGITQMYRFIIKATTTIPTSVVDTLEFSFVPPKYSNSNITSDLINTHSALQDYMVQLYFGQDKIDNPEYASKISRFKKAFAKSRLAMLNFDEIEEIFKDAMIHGTEDELNPDNQEEEDNG